MLRIALVLILPCLIAAETACPGGELSCPEGQTCCMVDNKQSCCDDLQTQLPHRSALLSVVSYSSIQNGPNDGCTMQTCNGTCCKLQSDKTGCCRKFKNANCCSNDICCDAMNSCCGGGCCPFPNNKCCSGQNEFFQQRWCCKKRCGLSYKNCFDGAAALAPTTLVSLVAAFLIVYTVKKL